MALITITEERQWKCHSAYVNYVQAAEQGSKSRTKTIRIFGLPIIKHRIDYVKVPDSEGSQEHSL